MKLVKTTTTLNSNKMTNKHEINRYIYVTSDDDIKKGDFIYIIRDGLLIEKINGIVKIESTTESQTKYVRLNEEKGWWASEVNYQKDWNYKKIIICNNPNLPIQQLTTEEVEYLKSVDSFEVEKIGYKKNGMIDESTSYNYKILIPQETEQPKESIEEVAEKKYPLTNILHLQLNTSIRTGFIEGYNHAKQTLYTEDEMIDFVEEYKEFSINSNKEVISFKEWFNKHKKQ